MELAGFEHLIAEADCIAHYDDHARRNCLHEVISRQLILNKRYSWVRDHPRDWVFNLTKKMQKYAN